MTRMTKFKNTSDGLIGMWGHTFDSNGDLDWQFEVIRRSGDAYLVKIYSWKDGYPSHVATINRYKLLGLKLYESSEALNSAMEKYKKMRREQREEQELRLQLAVERADNVVKLPIHA